MENELVFEAGELIIRPGIIAPGTYIIKSGRVRRESRGLFASLKKGDFFGEEGAFISAPANYSVVALEDTTLHLFDVGEFVENLMQNRELLQRVIGKLVSGNWDGMHKDKHAREMFVFALLEQVLEQRESSGEIPLATIVSQLGLSKEIVASVVEQIAFEEGSFLSLQGDMVLFSKENIAQFLSRRRVQLFITASMQHNIDDKRGVGKLTLLHTALQNR
ncbi:cyclic nucleotide-binding domain-containing protein [bacterium]|nr:cyclic nucleotide-binding domain-containing protein [bacterium]